MSQIAYIVMAFGGLLAVIGVVLFVRKGTEGTNVIKMFGFEFQLSGSALVIFVIGIIVFILPFIRPSSFRPDAWQAPNGVAEKQSQTNEAPAKTESELTGGEKPDAGRRTMGVEERQKPVPIENSRPSAVLSDAVVKKFILNWAFLQTNKDIGSYLRLYSPEFIGIKRTSSGREYRYNLSTWAVDRRKMYESAKGLVVTADDINIKRMDANSDTVTVEFTQHYMSENYSDHGQKLIKIKHYGSAGNKIIYEEMLSSVK